jgi:hypothetical protein
VVEGRIADRAEEHRIGRLAGGERLGWQRRPARAQGGSAHQVRGGGEGAAVAAADRVQDVDGGGDDLGADAVTGQQGDVHGANYGRVAAGAGESWVARTASTIATISASETCFCRSASSVICL